jgi:4-amino-4-deoxy-L-arabinose transferase-like glycosyltransferase
MPPSRLDLWLGAAAARAERRPRLALVLFCLLFFLPGFFALPPGDRDESRFAQATRQMVESGDYIRIRVGAEERNKKPVGIHWAQAAAVHLAEATGLGSRREIWPYRLPSLLGALLAVLATFEFGRLLVGRRAALLAGAMLAGGMVLMVEAHIAKTDAALLATVTAAMGLFARAYLRPEAFTARHAAAFWAILGLGVLLKGPIAPMVALLAGLTLALMDRPRGARGWFAAPWLPALRPGWGLPLMLLIVLPWMVAIGLATEGRFFAQAIGDDMLGKLGQGEEKHWGPPGYYLATFGIAAFPAAFLVLFALRQSWRERAEPVVRFLLAWIVPTWLLFEAVATKLPHYTLPAYPALMLLGARWAMDPLRLEPGRFLRVLARLMLGGVAIGLVVLAFAAPWFVARDWTAGTLLAIPAAGALVWLSFRALRAAAWARAAVLALLCAAPLYAAITQLTLPRIEALWIGPRLAAELERAAPGLDPARFGILGHAEPSTLFAIGGALRLLGTGEAAAGFLAEAPGRVVAVGNRHEADFRRAAAARGLALVPLGQVSGFNVSRGRHVTLSLFRSDEP